MKLNELIGQFIDTHQLRKDDVYLVAVSGGRDSVALLIALLEAGFKKLEVCHLNHCLRAEESDKDEAFVRELSNNKALPFHSLRVDVNSLDGSMELAARNARYKFFSKCYEDRKAKGIFLGHHADDQAETILFNLFRGGVGLQGMKQVGTRCEEAVEMTIFRPMLTTRRSDLTLYLEDYEQAFREDSSNSQPVASRNRLRNELIPLANDIMSRDIVERVNQAEVLESEQKECFIESIDYPSFLDPQGRIFLPLLQEIHPAKQRYILSKYLNQHEIPSISAEIVNSALKLVSSTEKSKINLPSGKYLRRKEKRMFIEG